MAYISSKLFHLPTNGAASPVIARSLLAGPPFKTTNKKRPMTLSVDVLFYNYTERNLKGSNK
jgi:hypothetical protein